MNRRFPMDLKIFDPEVYDESVMDTFPVADAAMQISGENAKFLAGLIKRYRPKTLLEVGVSAGGSTALLLHILEKLRLESEVVSVDLSERWYMDRNFPTGWAAKKLYPDKKNWQLHTGKFLPEIIEGLNLEFGFCFLDTAHSLPGELLDYLVVLPFMQEGGIVAMHDTALYFFPNSVHAIATRVLIDACVGTKIIPPWHSKDDANLSAFQITGDTYTHVINVFSALSMPWAYRLDEMQARIYRDFFRKYYGQEAAEWFSLITSWNNERWDEATMEKPGEKQNIFARLRARLARR